MSWLWIPVESYRRWVWRNRDYVQSLESLANGLTWLLPERFSDSEIAPEAVTAVLGIITAVNQRIIDTTPVLENGRSSEAVSFPYSICISAFKELETLVEVAAQQYYGNDKKWNFVAAMEAIKVLIRLAMFQSSGYKMLLNGEEVSNSSDNKDEVKPEFNSRFSHQARQGRHSANFKGKAMHAFTRFGENARITMDERMFRRVQHQQAIINPTETIHSKPTLLKLLSEKGVPGAFFVAGEILFITRPLIYVLLIRKFGSRKWTPWLVSLIVDVIGVGVLTKLATTDWFAKEQHLLFSESEMHELKRRKLLWALYLMRDPFFSNYTRKKLDVVEKNLESVPGFGLLVSKVVELAVGAQSRYTYISGS